MVCVCVCSWRLIQIDFDCARVVLVAINIVLALEMFEMELMISSNDYTWTCSSDNVSNSNGVSRVNINSLDETPLLRITNEL
mmetsp:Transcript_9106/g.13551  ORF Transcript_9106/g.13551 Transcript_9106/m.13551 type:complete len:82 (-) Transcript_9106:22-267(-)